MPKPGFPDHPPVEQTVEGFTTADLRQGVEEAVDQKDYEARLHYFFGRLFIVAREFGADERKLLFDATVLGFAKETPVTVDRFAGIFEAVYRMFVAHFRKKIRVYA